MFEVELKERRGFIIKKMVPDGACLFRAVGMKIFLFMISCQPSKILVSSLVTIGWVFQIS